MKNIFLLFSCCLFLIACDSCKNPDDNEIDCIGLNKPMPEATTTGRNTFGCKINGETWVAYTDSFGAIIGGEQKLDVRYSESSQHARILANKVIQSEGCDTVNHSFNLQMLNVEKGNITHFAFNGTFRDWRIGRRYNVDSLSTNTVTITEVNTENRILSGTFEVQFISNDGMDTLKVTDGRFDAPYTHL